MAMAAVAAAAFPPYAPPSVHHRRPRRASPVSTAGGRKHAERLLSSLVSVPDGKDPAAAADRLVRQFLASSSKAAALRTLSYLLSDEPSSSSPASHHLALPMYRRLRGAPWFRWNPELAAAAVPLLGELEAEAVVAEAGSRLEPRELGLFYGDLIESYARHGVREKVFETRERLQALQLPVGKGRYEPMIRALCLLGLPGEAEEMVEEMGVSGLKPSPFEYRLVLQAYGRMGLLAEMRRVLAAMRASGWEVDTLCANTVLSCYGGCGELAEMVTWLGQMRGSAVPFSIRTYNSALNSCPRLCSMLRSPQALPLSLERLVEELQEGGCAPLEALLVRELVGSDVLLQTLEWSPSEGRLDLHGCHLGSVLVIMLQWVDEMKARLLSVGAEGKDAPLEISIICGSGKHSSIRGESPVKRLVCEVMFRMKSPLRVDRKNVGRLVAQGTAVRDWLVKMEGF
uniref:Pentatricopeptide repeat-containing protein At2g17033 n=1 Tax=Anthurium amnicola TaxID=1678845 RepID=A0A1D1ZAT3_9ARAE